MQAALLDLTRKYGDILRGMSHDRYVEILQQVTRSGPARDASAESARKDPESRFTNVFCYRVLRQIEQQKTGIRHEFDASELSLI